jgi:hypothetical protein
VRKSSFPPHSGYWLRPLAMFAAMRLGLFAIKAAKATQQGLAGAFYPYRHRLFYYEKPLALCPQSQK